MFFALLITTFTLFFTLLWGLENYIPVVIEKISRDSTTFTQGIKHHNGTLFESAGLYGKSGIYHYQLNKKERISLVQPINKLVRLDEHLLPDNIFAEDIEIVDEFVYLLTWKAETLYIFNLNLEVIEKKNYVGEGWGIAYDGNNFITSDGSSELTFRNAKSFSRVKSVNVTYKGERLNHINSLEYIQNKIYANVWFDNNIYIISPITGVVLGVINCEDLIRDNLQSYYSKKTNKQFTFSQLRENVLNGISYDSMEKVFYFTGKRWFYFYKVFLKKR